MRIYNRMKLIIFALLCISLLAACQQQGAEPSDTVASAGADDRRKVVPVLTQVLRLENLKQEFVLPAALEAWEDLTIAAELGGPVEEVACHEGERVAAGDLLVKIDAAAIRTALTRDSQNVAVTQAKLERYLQLQEEGLVSEQDVDDLKNALTAAQAALKVTRIQLDKSRVTAPVAGFVDRLYVDRGEFIELGKPLLRLLQVDRLYAIVQVPEKDVTFLRLGQQVTIIPAALESGPEQVQLVSGRIAHIAYAADEATRTYRTKIAMDNSTGLLRPGMIVRAEFIRRHLDQVLAVPMFAVLDREGRKSVFVVEQGVAREVQVTLGPAVADRVVITAGLQAGQQLVVKGQQLLLDGSHVTVGSI